MSERLLGNMLLAAGGYFFVIKPILQKFGLQKTAEEEKADKAAKEAEDRKNNKQPLPDQWEPKDFNAWQIQSINNLDQYCKRMNKSIKYRGGKLADGYWTAPLYATLPNKVATIVNDSDSYFTTAKTAWEQVDSAIRECPTQLAVAYTCKVFKEKYHKDLKTLLDSSAKGLHWFDDAKDIMAGINKYVENLPVGLFWMTADNKLKLAA